MSQVKLNLFYPYPPERVWQVLTDRCALAVWMMDNDFEAKLGHKFQFHSQPLPGVNSTIRCEVVELEEPTRLVYTWQESSTAEPSLVIWTLVPVAGGTQLHLKHQEYSYTAVVAAVDTPGTIAQTDRYLRLFQSEMPPVASRFETAFFSSTLRCKNQSNLGIATVLELPPSQMFEWDYFLNQTLPELLAQDERIDTIELIELHMPQVNTSQEP